MGVTIIPYGNPSKVDVDQTYDATSTNAQSGMAVAEALKTVSGGSGDTKLNYISSPEIAESDAVKATGEGSLAIGNGVTVTGMGSIAIRTHSESMDGNMEDNIKITPTIDAIMSTSIGAYSTASGVGSVALGAFSVTPDDESVGIGYYKDGDTSTTLLTRRIVGVKDPTEDNNAATKGYVDSAIKEVKSSIPTSDLSDIIAYQEIKTKPEITSWYQSENTRTYAIAIGDNAKAGGHAVAIGEDSNANGCENNGEYAVQYSSVAILGTSGYDAVAIGGSATGTYSVAIGDQANAIAGGAIAIGKSASASGEHSVAIGYDSEATDSEVVSFGYEIKSEDGTETIEHTRRLIHITDPVNAQDAATKIYVDAKLDYVAMMSGLAYSDVHDSITAYDLIDMYRSLNLWYVTEVTNAGVKGWITADQANEIIGKYIVVS